MNIPYRLNLDIKSLCLFAGKRNKHEITYLKNDPSINSLALEMHLIVGKLSFLSNKLNRSHLLSKPWVYAIYTEIPASKLIKYIKEI